MNHMLSNHTNDLGLGMGCIDFVVDQDHIGFVVDQGRNSYRLAYSGH